MKCFHKPKLNALYQGKSEAKSEHITWGTDVKDQLDDGCKVFWRNRCTKNTRSTILFKTKTSPPNIPKG